MGRKRAEPDKTPARRIELDQEPVWSIQFDETLTQYRAFCLYRDLLEARSLSRVAEKWGGIEGAEPGKAGAPLSRLQEWSSRNRWVERAEAYDLHLERVYRESRETAISRMAQTEATLGRTMVSAAMRRLLGHEDAQDPTRSVAQLDIGQLTAGEVAMLAREGVHISRLSTNRPTSLIKGALMIHAREYEQDMAQLTEILFQFIPEDRRPAAAEEVRAFAAGERERKALTA